MAKVSIKAKPTFVGPVSISRPGEEPLVIPFVFKHRKKSELNAFADESKGKSDAEVVLLMAEGWEGVEEPFSLEAVQGLIDDYHGAAEEIADAYIEHLTKARRGN